MQDLGDKVWTFMRKKYNSLSWCFRYKSILCNAGFKAHTLHHHMMLYSVTLSLLVALKLTLSPKEVCLKETVP